MSYSMTCGAREAKERMFVYDLEREKISAGYERHERGDIASLEDLPG